jgi:nucleoid DNA-binding protein
MQTENKRLDAALAEMECLAESTPLAALGTFTEHIRKAREGIEP